MLKTILLFLVYLNILQAATNCLNGIKVRKEYRDMTRQEWLNFRNTISVLMTTPGTISGTTKYDEIVKVHLDSVPMAHGTPYFFTWHRAYMNYVEEEMRKINANDWAYDAQDPLSSPIFTNSYLGIRVGADGDCRQMAAYPRRHCLTRNYDPANFSTFYDQNAINMLLRNAQTMTYDTYRQWIETAPHGIVHSSIGGPGGDMTSMQSPNDPIFWLHHGQIDKLWDDFQKASGDVYRFNGRHQNVRVTLDDPIAPFKYTIRDIMDVSALCYSYQPFSLASTTRRNTNPLRLPSSLPEHWIEMVHLPLEIVRQQEQALGQAMLDADSKAMRNSPLCILIAVFILLLI